MRLKEKFQHALRWAQRYPVAVATVVILGYYFTSTFDLFKKSGKMNLTFLDFVLHYDSLVWIWLVAFVFLKLQKTKERFYDEEREKLLVHLQIEKSRVASSLLRDVTRQLQDTINNPLAVIGVMTDDIRKRFVGDPAVMRRLDQIDTSLNRIHQAIKDVANYQTSQVLEALQNDVKGGLPKFEGVETSGDTALNEAGA